MNFWTNLDDSLTCFNIARLANIRNTQLSILIYCQHLTARVVTQRVNLKHIYNSRRGDATIPYRKLLNIRVPLPWFMPGKASSIAKLLLWPSLLKQNTFFFQCSNKNDLRICSLLGARYQDTKRIDFQLQFLTTRWISQFFCAFCDEREK